MGRLKEIQQEMLDLLDEAKNIIEGKRGTHRFTCDRMKSYWHPSIMMALTDEHMYIGNGGATMEEAIKDIEGEGDEFQDLVDYAGDVEADALRSAINDDDISESMTVAEIIQYLLDEAEEPQMIRDYVDSACQEE